MRENGLSPIFSGLWMGKCFELHTVSEVFYQHGLLLPTLERLPVNVRSFDMFVDMSTTVWVTFAGSSLHCHFKTI